MIRLIVAGCVVFVADLFLSRVSFMHSVLFAIGNFGVSILFLTCLAIGYLTFTKVK